MRKKRLIKQPCSNVRFKVIMAVIAIVSAGALMTVLFSCPNPIGDILAKQIADADVPNIAISSPTDGGVYGGRVVIEGSVADAGGDVKSLAVDVPVAELNETVELGEEGEFSYSFSAHGITETIFITLTAKDWNGNESSKTITLFNDGTGPHIEITEPDDYSPYSTVVRVSGSVTDAAGTATTDEVSACTYSIPGTSVAGDLTLDSGGAFSFEFATRNSDGTQVIDGPATIEIVAEDWNGNSTTEEVTVVRSETGDFASITVSTGSKQVTIEWEPVLYAESYTIFESKYGRKRENVTSPFIWDDLKNGEIYRFQTKAEIPDDKGEDAYSCTIEKMPLSVRSFAPWVREVGYRSITIEWWDNPHVSEYRVERRLSLDSPWEVQQIMTSTLFTDSQLTFGEEYQYRISPVDFNQLVSEKTVEKPGRFGYKTVGNKKTSGHARGLDVDEHYVYIVDGSYLSIINIDNPEEPILTSSLSISNARDVAVSGSYAYIGTPGGLSVVDISDPEEPIILGSAPINVDPYGLAVSGSYAYLICNSNNFVIFDVNDPNDPTVVSTMPVGGMANDVVIVGSYAYVASENVGLVVIDIDDPESPEIVGTVSTNRAWKIAVSGEYAYIADWSEGLTVANISNPNDPEVICTVATPGYAQGVDVSGPFAYVADGNGIVVFNVLNPSLPKLVGNSSTSGNSNDVRIDGNYAYVADGATGLSIVDISSPSNLSIESNESAGGSRDISVSGEYAYIAASSFIAVNIADTENPFKTDSIAISGHARGVDVANTHAYVVNGYGLSVVTIEDPENLDIVGTVETPGIAQGVYVAGEYAYIGDGAGLTIVDIVNPVEPTVFGQIPTSGIAVGVTVSDNHAYVAADNLVVIDVTDITAPVFVGQTSEEIQARAVEISGSYAYVASENGLSVIDIADPATPVVVGDTPSTLYSSRDIALSGSYAYIAEHHPGGDFFAVSVADPTNPSIISNISTTSDWNWGLAVNDTYAYVACSDGGIAIIDLLSE